MKTKTVKYAYGKSIAEKSYKKNIMLYKCRMCLIDKTEGQFIKGHWNECRSCVRDLAHFYEMILKSDK